jgi:hypothetical protein
MGIAGIDRLTLAVLCNALTAKGVEIGIVARARVPCLNDFPRRSELIREIVENVIGGILPSDSLSFEVDVFILAGGTSFETVLIFRVL